MNNMNFNNIILFIKVISYFVLLRSLGKILRMSIKVEHFSAEIRAKCTKSLAEELAEELLIKELKRRLRINRTWAVTGQSGARHITFSLSLAFSSPEPTILLACGRNRELWEQPF